MASPPTPKHESPPGSGPPKSLGSYQPLEPYPSASQSKTEHVGSLPGISSFFRGTQNESPSSNSSSAPLTLPPPRDLRISPRPPAPEMISGSKKPFKHHEEHSGKFPTISYQQPPTYFRDTSWFAIPGQPISPQPAPSPPQALIPGAAYVPLQAHPHPFHPHPHLHPHHHSPVAAPMVYRGPTYVPVAHNSMERGMSPEIKRRTKTGCLTCRKRRIKCDEQRPICKNCAKSERICLGYDPILGPGRAQRARAVQLRRSMVRKIHIGHAGEPSDRTSSDRIECRTWTAVADIFLEKAAGSLDKLLGSQRITKIARSVRERFSSPERITRVAGELEAMRQLLSMMFGDVIDFGDLDMLESSAAFEKLRMTDDYILLRAISEALVQQDGQFLPVPSSADDSLLQRLYVLNRMLYLNPRSDGEPVSNELLTKVAAAPVLTDEVWALGREVSQGRRIASAQADRLMAQFTASPKTASVVVLLIAIAGSTAEKRSELLSIVPQIPLDPVFGAIVEIELAKLL